MKGLKENILLRGCAILLCILCGASAFWSGLLLCTKWDDLWSAGDFYQSGSIDGAISPYRQYVFEAMRLRLSKDWGYELSYLERARLENLEELLNQTRTNFRFQVRDHAGVPLWGNQSGASTENLDSTQKTSFTVGRGEEYRQRDEIVWKNAETWDYHILRAATPDGWVTIDPKQDTGGDSGFNQYGYFYDSVYDEWEYSSDRDTRLHAVDLVLELGVKSPLTAKDEFMSAWEEYNGIQDWLTPVTVICLGTLIATVLLLSALCSGAGHRKGIDGIVLGWQDRIPYDIYLILQVGAFSILVVAADPIAYSFNRHGLSFRVVVGLGFFSLIGTALALAALLTTVVRLKAHVLLRGTLCWRLLAGVGRWVRRVVSHWSVTRRIVGLFFLYLLGTVITTPTLFLIPVFQGFVLWALCRWARQWRIVRDATQAIVSGNPEVQIDTRHMYHDLQAHAEQLNDLGIAVTHEVEERLKSERFKAELITNVSHDLKTPLTSIINYVDLLKKTEIQDPVAKEYIAVLERKSQRLKKLTEDLVEASKASTGTLPVSLERLDFAQLLSQAMGEYAEKFEVAGLSPVLDAVEGDNAIQGDGRHLWRVMDNLLGNCCKYAMSGTRVYLELRRWGENVVLTVKNISKNPLNIQPEQLMERFVRGESSRSTEGSGLGLSIARSLTELQGGSFRVEIDGDLFKAVVSMPGAQELPSIPDVKTEELTP